ncbi:hypothetical protein WN71_012445 [Streptomyces mangrovisoli]|uniref:Serine/threonine protein kinase n=1 Tax=Streptomyces mangrovisoli TaxID=1428628 RepID=A0A1J4P260_9ACTN|nr:hypothetical protein WN71_012445 [Streptomyces mangrovisoli]
MWSVVGGAAVVGVAVSLVLTFVLGGGTGSQADTSPPVTPLSTGPETPGDSTPPSSPSPSPSATLPAGYASYEDQEGFRIAHPTGWSRSTRASAYGMDVVNYRSPDRTRRIQVYQVAESSPDASFDLFLSDATPKNAAFQKLSLDNLDHDGFTGSRLEYTTGPISGEPDVGTWHVFDERFVAADGDIYAVAVYGPDDDTGADSLELLTTAVDWFCPDGATCPAPTA